MLTSPPLKYIRWNTRMISVISVENFNIFRKKHTTEVEKKGKPSAFTCLWLNWTEIPYNTWWIDYGYIVHVSKAIQRFLTTQPVNTDEIYVYMGNRLKALVEDIGAYRLIHDTRCHLDLLGTCYVPSLLRNLVSLSRFYKTRYTFNFHNGCFSL